jgi:hypothetical protein
MLVYLHNGSYMFWHNNAILLAQLGSFPSYFNINMEHMLLAYVLACYAANCDGTLPSSYSLYALGSILSQFDA